MRGFRSIGGEWTLDFWLNACPLYNRMPDIPPLHSFAMREYEADRT